MEKKCEGKFNLFSNSIGFVQFQANNTVISRTVKTSDESWLTVWDSVLASSGAMSDLFPVHFGVRPQSHTSVTDSISS